jgi:hypothetical protein
MTTYIVQYRQNDLWQNYKDDTSFAIEFLHYSAAAKVARDLSKLETMPFRQQDWQIVDSKGRKFPVQLS